MRIVQKIVLNYLRLLKTASYDLFFFQEAEAVKSMSFHPTGDLILVGTEHPTSEFFFPI